MNWNWFWLWWWWLFSKFISSSKLFKCDFSVPGEIHLTNDVVELRFTQKKTKSVVCWIKLISSEEPIFILVIVIEHVGHIFKISKWHVSVLFGQVRVVI